MMIYEPYALMALSNLPLHNPTQQNALTVPPRKKIRTTNKQDLHVMAEKEPYLQHALLALIKSLYPGDQEAHNAQYAYIQVQRPFAKRSKTRSFYYAYRLKALKILCMILTEGNVDNIIACLAKLTRSTEYSCLSQPLQKILGNICFYARSADNPGELGLLKRHFVYTPDELDALSNEAQDRLFNTLNCLFQFFEKHLYRKNLTTSVQKLTAKLAANAFITILNPKLPNKSKSDIFSQLIKEYSQNLYTLKNKTYSDIRPDIMTDKFLIVLISYKKRYNSEVCMKSDLYQINNSINNNKARLFKAAITPEDSDVIPIDIAQDIDDYGLGFVGGPSNQTL